MADLIERMLQGDRLALSRLISQVENRTANVLELMARIYPHTGKVATVGITGPPGAGKSTFVDRLIAAYRQAGKKVGVIAVDPSSPFTGGAILGDRIRMVSHAADEGVFIRSLGSRGHLGGLTMSTSEVVKLFDAFGMDVVLIETVGVGQSEFSVMEVADTVVVLLVPESGDTIQTMKAGLLEVADVFVVNKADRDGADKIRTELQLMVHLKGVVDGWEVPVFATVASRSEGIGEVFSAIAQHQTCLHTHPRARRADALKRALQEIVREELALRVARSFDEDPSPLLLNILPAVESGELDPYSAALRLVSDPGELATLIRSR